VYLETVVDYLLNGLVDFEQMQHNFVVYDLMLAPPREFGDY
jgi:Ser/Thr protein kinase RdoA (MazF antagonist)